MRLAIALIHYALAFVLLWSLYGTAEWNALSVGFPHTDREYATAMLVSMALLAKLMGHIWLFSSARAR